ncbi:MAG: TonB-dependent receptor [Bacteroidaceae bacterium]|nr:TonB-dependent receptor [Bacteroidaceae bacterium]
MFFRHMQLNEVTVTGVTGKTKLKHSTAPISLVDAKKLRSTASTDIIDALAHQPGMSQLTTGSGISKPIIRGLGYNRVVVMSEGVRQEGQQWGDEHGVEVDGGSVNSVEILKGPASLMYGSDAMAGVVILHSQPTLIEGELKGNATAEYQTNNGLLGYSLNLGGNQQGLVWDARWSGKLAHAYKNKYDGYVPGSQFKEMAGRFMMGLQKQWGYARLTGTWYHQTPGIIEGERDATTGTLVCSSVSPKSYKKSLPYQQVKHFKLVSDNSLNLSHGWLKAIIGYQQNRRQEFEEHDHDEDEDAEHDEATFPALFFKLHTITYDLRYLTSEFSGWKLSAGTQGMWQQSQNLGEEFLIPAYHLFDVGLYATASKQLNRWTLNGGVRYDHRYLHGEALKEEGVMRFTDFSRDFNGVTGSVGAVWNMSDHLNLRLNVARGFRAPNMSELGSNGSHEGALRYELGNQQLNPEYSLQADLGIDFTSRYVSAQLALFANRIDNYIFMKGNEHHRVLAGFPDEPQGHPVYRYTQGDARLLGFEAGVDFHPIHSLHFENTFSLVDARQLHETQAQKYLPYTPAPRWTSELKWELLHHSHPTIGSHSRHTHQAKGLSADNLYITATLECYLKQSHVYSVDNTETATPGYTLLNLSAGTELTWKGKKVADLYVTADNLLNRAYQNHLSRLKYADINSMTGRQGVFNMGRNITFKLIVPINIL